MVTGARRYRILEPIGRGGFGTIYRAEMIGLGQFQKPVALKILNADVSGSPEIVRRLRDEARMLGIVRHSGIIHVDSLICIDDRWALVMEYFDGVGLDEVSCETTMPLRCALEITGRMADALQAAHTACDDGQPLNLIHRDIKPSNILLSAKGEVKLLDFGIARGDFNSREAVTRSMMFGSPEYMAPERWGFEERQAGDIYSLGAVLYELITGLPLGRTTGSRDKHEEKLLEALGTLKEGNADEACQLIAQMLAFEHRERPRARDVEQACRALLPQVSGPWLRDWAEKRVPEVAARRDAIQDDHLSGRTLTEYTGSQQIPAPRQLSIPLPRGSFLVYVVLGFVATVAVGLGGALLVGVLSAPDSTPVEESGREATQIERAAPQPAEEEEPTGAPAAASAEEARTLEGSLKAPPATEARALEAPAPEVKSAKTQGATPRSTGTGSSSAQGQASATSVPAEPIEPPDTGQVRLTGGATSVRLVSGSLSLPPGEVPAGSYVVMATFPSRGTVKAGRIAVAAGQTVTLNCDAGFAMCAQAD